MRQDELISELNIRLQDAMQKADKWDADLWKAMEYSLMAGGKRIRPVLLMLCGESLGAPDEDLWPFALAMEMIHTYSLIHDDLPAMDNDDYRRGRLTNHKVFGEAEAILAGDGLLTLAFETMGKACEQAMLQSNPGLVRQYSLAMSYMASCAGTKGMVAGQIADLKSEGRRIGLDELTYIEFNKTSRLLMAAMVCGSVIAGNDLPERSTVSLGLEKAAGKIGLAFQIMDDVLDVESSLEELGKMPLSDEKAEKATFVSLYGVEEAKRKAGELTEEALSELTVLPGESGENVRKLVSALAVRKS